MPAYDYRCAACDETFEVTRSIGDASEVRCPSCDGASKRVYTPIGVVFKGSGFHNTDYRKKGSTPSDAPKADAPKSGGCPAADSGGSCAGCPATSD